MSAMASMSIDGDGEFSDSLQEAPASELPKVNQDADTRATLANSQSSLSDAIETSINVKGLEGNGLPAEPATPQTPTSNTEDSCTDSPGFSSIEGASYYEEADWSAICDVCDNIVDEYNKSVLSLENCRRDLYTDLTVQLTSVFDAGLRHVAITKDAATGTADGLADKSSGDDTGAGDTPKTDGTPKVDDTPEGDGTPKADDTAEGDGTPKADDTAEGDGTPKVDGTPEADDTPNVNDVPTVDGKSKPEDQPKPEVTPSTEEAVKDFLPAALDEYKLALKEKFIKFEQEIKGVMHVSERAMRHAVVAHDWADTTQVMLHQIKVERQKLLDYIEEREINLTTCKQQFASELQEQGEHIQRLVEQMKSYKDLQERGEAYCKTIGECSTKPLEENIIDVLVRRRLDTERTIALNLATQTKISELKLFILHQQNCIHQLQHAHEEMIGYLGNMTDPDCLEVVEASESSSSDDEGASDKEESSMPGSDATPVDSDKPMTPENRPTSMEEHCMNSVDRYVDQDQGGPEQFIRSGGCPLSLVSDVVYCDRGEYLPGTSTDGDVAAIQTFGIGADSDQIQSGRKVVFDPLAVPYVRRQCQQAEESERTQHSDACFESGGDCVCKLASPQSRETSADNLQTLQNGLASLNMTPDVEPSADMPDLQLDADEKAAAGDSVGIVGQKAMERSPEKDAKPVDSEIGADAADIAAPN